MAKKFDKSRSFATVHGSTVGVTYRQDGKYFNHAGDEVHEVTGMLVSPAPAPAQASERAPAPSPKTMLTVDPPVIPPSDDAPPADPVMTSRTATPLPPAVTQDPPSDYDPSKIDPKNLSRADFEFWAENEEGFKDALTAAGHDPLMWSDFKEQARKAFGVEFPSKVLWRAHITGKPVLTE